MSETNNFKDVVITTMNDTKIFNYKGIEIDRTTWEQAPCPMCCKDIDDDSMCAIVVTLYENLNSVYDEDDMNDYIEYVKGKEFSFERQLYLEDMNDFRWIEEEELFCEWGGIYYEDIYEDII